jgi:hypothetical protein
MPEIEDSPILCATCSEAEENCSCWECSNCGDNVSGEACSRCEQCSDCCDCWTCEGCDGLRSNDDSRCTHCEHCDSCCECRTCQTYRCDTTDTGSNDVSICGNCQRCDIRHCECYVCSNCGHRTESSCDNCNECSDCCDCIECPSCETRREDGGCSSCRRCDDCGHASLCEPSGEAVPDEDYSPSVVTQFHPRYAVRDSYCPSCGNLGCTCRFCWDRSGDRPVVAHTFSTNYVERLCGECGTCLEHCRSALVCVTCPEGKNHHKLCEYCNQCDTHCNCYVCQCCTKKRKAELLCLNCLCCLDKCRCPKCPKCKASGRHCQFCRECKTCCTSETSECGAFERKHPIPCKDTDLVFHRPANRLGFRTNGSAREVGIEIETNGIQFLDKSKKLYDAINKWNTSVKPDGSIGSQPTAFELNLMPSSGDKVIEQVHDLCAGLQAMSANPSQKCGIHVHVNCADVTSDDLKRIIDVYVRVERALYELCHPLRLVGRYSERCGQHYVNYGKTGREVRKRIADEFFGASHIKGLSKVTISVRCPRCDHPTVKISDDLYRCSDSQCQRTIEPKKARLSYIRGAGKSLKESKASGNSKVSRYRALNLVSLFKRQTIEFRHFHASTDPIEISSWAMVVCEVINASVRLSHRQVAVLPKNSKKALLAVLPQSLHPWVFSQWSRMDEIVKDSSMYQAQRKDAWGI